MSWDEVLQPLEPKEDTLSEFVFDHEAQLALMRDDRDEGGEVAKVKKKVRFDDKVTEIQNPRWIETAISWQLHRVSWHKLRTVCRKNGVKANGTREELQARLLNLMQTSDRLRGEYLLFET